MLRENTKLVRGGSLVGHIICISIWFAIGVFFARLVVLELLNPGLHWGLSTFLVVWTLLWIFGGLYGMRDSWKKEQVRLAYRRAYHSPVRLELRDDLSDLRYVRGQRWISAIGVVIFLFVWWKSGEFHPWVVLCALLFVYNWLRCRFLVKKLERKKL
ncbi:MAG: hypothetical protein ACSHX6_02870 [Akkermansiaceae bacterium]